MRLRSLVLCAMVFGLSPSAVITLAQNASGTPDGANAANSNIEGAWQGTINSAAGKLRLVLRVSKADNGALKATLDSPDQGAMGLPVDAISLSDSFLRFEMKAIQATFDGGLSRDGTEIAGSFRQGLPSPMVFKRESPSSAAPGVGLTRGRIKLDPCNFTSLL